MPAERATEMWAAYCQATGTPVEREHEVGPFGDSPALADKLADLVVRDVKHATCGMVADYEADGSAISEPGHLWVVVDGREQACCIVVTTSISVAPFDTADEEFARDEGEGDGSLAYWQDAHRRFFARRCAELGITWHESLPVVFERFERVWPPPVSGAH